MDDWMVATALGQIREHAPGMTALGSKLLSICTIEEALSLFQHTSPRYRPKTGGKVTLK